MGERGCTDDDGSASGPGSDAAPGVPARRVADDELVLSAGPVPVPSRAGAGGTQTAAGTPPVHSSSWTLSRVALRRSLRRASSSAAAGLLDDGAGPGSPPPPPPPTRADLA